VITRILPFASTVLLLQCLALAAYAQSPNERPSTTAPDKPTAPEPVSPATPAAPGAPMPEGAPPPTAASASDSDAALTRDPAPQPSAARTQTAPAPLDGPHAKQVLRVLADRERSARYAGAYSMFISGAAAITAGLLADVVYDRSYGRPLWVIGAVVEVGGVLNLFRSGTFERLAHDADNYSAEQLQSEWAQRALSMRYARKIGGVASLALGALTIGAGGAIAAGLGKLDTEPRENWTTALIAIGGGVMGGGVTSLLVESPLESSYRAAYGTDADGTPISLSFTPTYGGAAFSLRASF